MGERWASGSRYNDTELCPAHPLPFRRTTRRHFLLNPHVDYGPELARERIAERVRDKQHQAWNKAKRTGMSFVGPRRVLPARHLVDAGVPWGALWAWAVEQGKPGRSFVGCPAGAGAPGCGARCRLAAASRDKRALGDETECAGCLHRHNGAHRTLTRGVG